MIATAKQDGNTVAVYHERGIFLFRRNGILVGFTATTVTINEGSSNATYDERGRFLFRK